MVLPLVDVVGSKPIAATRPASAVVDPSGVMVAGCPTFTIGTEAAGTLPVTCTAPGTTITMDDVPELAPTTKGWLATFPATGLVSVAPARLLLATASATAAASTAAWSTVIRDACDCPPVAVVEAPLPVPVPLRVALLLVALVGLVGVVAWPVAWLPVEVPVELVCSVRWSAACAAPTFCCAASAAVSAAVQSLPTAAPAALAGLLGEGDGEGEGEGEDEGDAVVPSPLGDAVGEGGDELLPGAPDGLDPHALVAASSAFCATASSELLPEVVGPALAGAAAVVRAPELLAGALLVLVLVPVPALVDVVDVGALSVSSVAFALSSDAVAATTAFCSAAVSMVASFWPLLTVAPTCVATVVTTPVTGNETFVWSTFCTVPVTVSSCSTSPVATMAVR